MGSEVALGRPACAARGELRDRSPSSERGRDPGGIQARRKPRPARLRVRAAHRALSLRPEEGQAAPGRSGLSQWLRRRRAASASPLLLDGRIDRELSRGRRDQAEDAADLGLRLAEWRGPAGRGAGADADQSVPLVGAPRRGASEEELNLWGRAMVAPEVLER